MEASPTLSRQNQEFPRAAVEVNYFKKIFTHDMPLALSKARVSMYADHSTLYMSATTATEMTATLNK
jgi:hypothetical protein